MIATKVKSVSDDGLSEDVATQLGSFFRGVGLLNSIRPAKTPYL
jgi:hypothetical protein